MSYPPDFLVGWFDEILAQQAAETAFLAAYRKIGRSLLSLYHSDMHWFLFIAIHADVEGRPVSFWAVDRSDCKAMEVPPPREWPR